MDFDCKKRQGANDEDVRKAEEKFAESLHLAQLGNLISRRKKKNLICKKILISRIFSSSLGMHNLLDGSGVEHISQLTQFSEVKNTFYVSKLYIILVL